jgi:hypothetical protein
MPGGDPHIDAAGLDRSVLEKLLARRSAAGTGVLNLQNVKGQVKPYQVRQSMRLVDRYALRPDEGE